MNGTTLVIGNTYPVKDKLRELGGTWDPRAKGWRVPNNKLEEAQVLVAGAPKSTKSIRTSSGLCTRCGDDCGGTAFRCNYE